MTHTNRGFAQTAAFTFAGLLAIATFGSATAAAAQAGPAQKTPSNSSAQSSAQDDSKRDSAPSQSSAAGQSNVAEKDRWLHVRVIGDSKDEVVRVNVPIELAEKVLPAINHDRLHNGKVSFDSADTHGVDLRALLAAVKSSRDGEFVTVQERDSDVRVAKQNGHLIVHVLDKGKNGHGGKTQVEVKVPMKVVDALLSAGDDELDLVAALHALSAQGDTELVSVKDDENTIRVWLDSKNVSD